MLVPPHGTTDRIQWNLGDDTGMQHVLYSDVSGNPGTGQHLTNMQEAVQAAIDVRIALAELSLDEEWLTTDPDLKTVFHGDADGKKIALATHIIVRTWIIETLTWNGTKYNFRVRKA